MIRIQVRFFIALTITLTSLITYPVLAQSEILTLDSLLSKAIANNKKLKYSSLELQKTEELKKKIYHTYIPTLEIAPG